MKDDLVHVIRERGKHDACNCRMCRRDGNDRRKDRRRARRQLRRATLREAREEHS